MFLGFGLIIAAGILLWPAGNRGQAAGPMHVIPVDRVMLPVSPQITAEVAETAPSPTPTYPPLLTPTALSIPNVGLVWCRNAAGVYLWKSPEGNILARLPNGTVVRILEERSSYGNLPWIKINSPLGEGWILQTQVFRKFESAIAYVAIDGGTYLRDQPSGGIQQMLPVGTPIMKFIEEQETEEHAWVRVEVVDGTVGWVVEEWLSVEMPIR
jgi:hypothetical protein